MILIIGGAHCGKRGYAAATFGYAFKQMSDQLDDAPVLYDLQALLRNQDFQALLPTLLQKRAVICNEVGCGVVPIDDNERAWRERVGRACCALAQLAERVIRVQCGVGIVIKGEPS